MSFSAELKKYRYRDYLPNDWYEYVKYDTTNKMSILLQKNGLSHKTAAYLSSDEKRFISRTKASIKLRMEVFSCECIKHRAAIV